MSKKKAGSYRSSQYLFFPEPFGFIYCISQSATGGNRVQAGGTGCHLQSPRTQTRHHHALLQEPNTGSHGCRFTPRSHPNLEQSAMVSWKCTKNLVSPDSEKMYIIVHCKLHHVDRLHIMVCLCQPYHWSTVCHAPLSQKETNVATLFFQFILEFAMTLFYEDAHLSSFRWATVLGTLYSRSSAPFITLLMVSCVDKGHLLCLLCLVCNISCLPLLQIKHHSRPHYHFLI